MYFLIVSYNHGNNIVGLVDVLPNFSFTTSETRRDFWKKQDVYELPHELPNDLRLRILGNKEKSIELFL